MLAEAYDAAGHEVVVLDLSARAFDRLPTEFRGHAVRGDGTDEDTLRRAGATGADVFLALTEGDNRNVMAAQLAAEKLGIVKVVAKINDPVRAAAYADLGIATLCRTTLQADAISAYLGLGCARRTERRSRQPDPITAGPPDAPLAESLDAPSPGQEA